MTNNHLKSDKKSFIQEDINYVRQRFTVYDYKSPYKPL